MSAAKSWICDGVPKNGQHYPNCSGPHPPEENHTPDCMICGLPREAITGKKSPQGSKTVLSGGRGSNLPGLVAIALLVLLLGASAWYFLGRTREPEVVESTSETVALSPGAADPLAKVSQTAVNAELISQGEKILFNPGVNFSQKTAGATAFSQDNWTEAVTQYQQAVQADPNDPEAKIYFHNARAKQAGNPLTIAIVVPISASENSAKEVLRGVALQQERYNNAPQLPGRLLEVVIVNESEPGKAPSLAEDLIQSPNVLGVMGHGVDAASREAIARYERAQLAVLSPISTSISSTVPGQSILKTISLAQKANELFANYLEGVGKTLATYAEQKVSSPAVVVFYNSDSPYSQQLKDAFSAALMQTPGQVVKEVDITQGGFNPGTEVSDAAQLGANVGVLALSKNKVETAVAIAQANANAGTPLTLLGGDELYNPNILKDGDAAINGLVLAVPWRWQEGDAFASQATNIWQGRVSWRTATAYDTTQALANAITQKPTRAETSQLLQNGIAIAGTATDFSLFDRIPLVQAVPGTSAGYRYQFEPI
ncbi:ABC transporter substrate-binding protein [Laspinema olomoucense]|uniref:ABC transporter substrate-binding protein n=1 Tax=Laspinema olomoucense D3b TaxID=2953688 RepID=A0ABT2NIW0_9CYAN|nr:ABC transporter substrate-binding protein [Laspinema sp. D3b]MCT7981231.1 ABC transporter substrate-binding protein [Laspinema sp. D3b]